MSSSSREMDRPLVPKEDGSVGDGVKLVGVKVDGVNVSLLPGMLGKVPGRERSGGLKCEISCGSKVCLATVGVT